MIKFLDIQKINLTHQKVIEETILKAFRSGWYILGEAVEIFEKNFASCCGVKHFIGVSKGLDALILTHRTYIEMGKIEEWDEIIVPANTYIATIFSITHNKLKSVLVESKINTYNINPSLIEEKITNKTKAIMPSHLYEQCADLEAIHSIEINIIYWLLKLPHRLSEQFRMAS